jgi:hypothetical protein
MKSQGNLGEVLYSKDDKDLPSAISFEEWVMRWWQWMYSIPDANSPAHDRNWKTAGAIPQPHEEVFFLAGTFSDKAKRTCELSPKRAVLFPIATMAASDAEFPDGKLDELASQGNQVKDMKLSIVNKKESKTYELGTSDLKAYDIKTRPFNVDIPEDNICYWVPGKKGSTAVSHGFWAFLRPLSAGEYDIRYSQETQDDPQTLTKNCSYEVEYNLKVK